jgi:hypothetical protein
MAREEDELWPILRARLPANERARIQRATIASFSPDELRLFLEDILPAVAPAERQRLTGAVRAIFAGEAARALPAGA